MQLTALIIAQQVDCSLLSTSIHVPTFLTCLDEHIISAAALQIQEVFGEQAC